MKKNMFNVIKVTVIIAVLLTTCNIGICNAQNYKVANINPYINYHTVNNNNNDENIEEEEIIVSEDDLVYADETNNDVMGEVNNVETYVEPEPEPVVVEPVVTNTYYNNDYGYQVLALINQIRRENGLGELYMDYTLIQVANVRAEEATRNWSHTRPDGSQWWTLHQQFGLYGKFGENLAYGQMTPEAVVQAWMNSEGHRANILSADFHSVGISSYYNDGIYYWAQEFAS